MNDEKEIVAQPIERAIDVAPQIVLSAAQEASKALMKVVEKKPKKITVNGKQYLEYCDWQTLGKFYGLFVKTGTAEPVEVFGTKGAKATAEIYDKQGIKLGGAEAYCMFDEKNWKDKPWFQLASMAQTRAGAKSLRNVLGWVAVLAGFADTPAEEMQVNGTYSQPSAKAPVNVKPVENGETIAMREDCKTELIRRAKGDIDAAANLLEEMTQFQGRDGTMVKGLRSCQYLKGARLEILYSKLFPKPKAHEGYSNKKSDEEAKAGLKNPFSGEEPQEPPFLR